MTEQNTVIRSRRLRKKLHLDEFAILGFEFTCKIAADDDGNYDSFFNDLKDVVDTRNLFINFDGDQGHFIGFVTSAERYGNATEDDRKAIEDAFNAHAKVSDMKVDRLVNAYYEL
jgi:uncharacterized protein YggL (DUF469 family)